MDQYNELLRIIGQFKLHKMNMDESIDVSSVIDKLSPSWKDFKHNLYDKTDNSRQFLKPSIMPLISGLLDHFRR